MIVHACNELILACVSVRHVDGHEELLEVEEVVAVAVEYSEDVSGDLARVPLISAVVLTVKTTKEKNQWTISNANSSYVILIRFFI